MYFSKKSGYFEIPKKNTVLNRLYTQFTNMRDDQEFMNGVVCVAVPVEDAEGVCYGGIAVSAPEARMSLNQVLGFVPQMMQAALRLANTYRSPRPVEY